MAEKLLLPVIKRFVSDSSSKEDSVSSRCSKDPEGVPSREQIEYLQMQGRGHRRLQRFPS